MGFHALHHHLGLDVAGILFTRGVDIGHKGDIRRLGAGEVVVKQALDAAEGVRLHDGPHAVVRLTDGDGDGIAHLGGVMAVVVIELYALDFAGQLKPSVRALEFAQGIARGLHIALESMRAAERRQRVHHLEFSRHLQRHVADDFAAESEIKRAVTILVEGKIGGPVVALVAQTEAERGAAERLKQLHDAAVVAVADGDAMRRQQREELAEGFLNMIDIAVKIQMIRVDVQHHRDRGTHVQEAGIELAGLGQEHAALADTGAAADEIKIAADVDGGIHFTLHQHLRKHGGGGGLAMRAAHADGGIEALHQLTQQRCTLDIGQSEAGNLKPLRIIRQDGYRIHHQIRTVNVFREMADGDGNMQIIPQMLCGIRFQPVRAGDDIALLLKHLRQAAHAAAADADHMDMLALIIANMGYGHDFHPFHEGLQGDACRFNQSYYTLERV